MMASAQAWAMMGMDDSKGKRWRVLQNCVIRERIMKENTHSQNEWVRRGPQLPHKHMK
jgi:hypothetical protein